MVSTPEAETAPTGKNTGVASARGSSVLKFGLEKLIQDINADHRMLQDPEKDRVAELIREVCDARKHASTRGYIRAGGGCMYDTLDSF